jgi:hypothetical protein
VAQTCRAAVWMQLRPHVVLERAARVEEDVAICCSIVPSRWGMVACVGAFPEGTHGSRWSGNGCGRRGVSVGYLFNSPIGGCVNAWLQKYS